jgi:pimeloyl-ACP methyl ester carboxylesterase
MWIEVPMVEVPVTTAAAPATLPPLPALPPLRHRMVATNGIGLHVAEAGPEDGPSVILLHGFPEFWYGWRHQIGYLAGLGYRVWAPDLRGYNLSEKPPRRADYRIGPLAADVLGLIEAAGGTGVVLIGHDWGGILTWWLASHHPDSLTKAVILNAPHPAAFRRHVLTSPRQMLRSAYIAFFQLPGVAEWSIRRRHWRLLEQALRQSSREGTFSEAELAYYRDSWSQPGAATAMLNWYRAATWTLLRRSGQRIRVPLLLLWGTRDTALDPELAERSIGWCDAGQLIRWPTATHWLHHEQPAEINAAIGGFLQS